VQQNRMHYRNRSPNTFAKKILTNCDIWYTSPMWRYAIGCTRWIKITRNCIIKDVRKAVWGMISIHSQIVQL